MPLAELKKGDASEDVQAKGPRKGKKVRRKSRPANT